MYSMGKSIVLSLLLTSTLFYTTSCGSNNGTNIEIAGVKGPKVALVQDNLVVTAVFENIQMEGGLRYNIPKYKYSYLEVAPDTTTNGTALTITVSLEDLINGGLDTLDPQKLPGGRNLPGVVGGKLPAVAFSIEKFNNMTFYVSKDMFGMFLPSQVGVDGAIASFRYYVANKAAGTISLVGNDSNGENSGILLMLDMNNSVKQQLKSLRSRYH